MKSIGQSALISSPFGLYDLGDSEKALYGSTTSINRQRFIKLIAMTVSKGLGFPVVALPSVGHMPTNGAGEQDAARVLYVAATRATQRPVIGVGGDEGFGMRLEPTAELRDGASLENADLIRVHQ
jgi:superfamily I DNA/RNA helicase